VILEGVLDLGQLIGSDPVSKGAQWSENGGGS